MIFKKLFIVLSLATASFKVAAQQDNLLQKADSLFESGEYKQCIQLYTLSDTISNNSNSKKSLYSKCQLAECYIRLGKLEEALDKAQYVLKNCPIQNKQERTESLLSLGQIALLKGRQEEAESFYLNAFNIIKDEKPSIYKAKCFDQLGLLNWIKGNQEKAKEYIYQSLEMRKSLVGEKHPLLAASYNNLGLINSTIDPQAALENYQKALNIYKSIYPLQHPTIGISLNNIGIIERQLGATEQSISTFEKSLDLWTRLYGKEHSTIAFVFSNIGESYFENNQYQLALDNLYKALQIYKVLYGEKHPELSATYNSIGNVYLHQHNHQQALENFQLSICANAKNFNSTDPYTNPPLKNYYNPDLLLVSLLLKAKTLDFYHHEKTLKLKDLETAFSTYILCDSLIGKLRQSRTSTKDKIELGKYSSQVYENATILSEELSSITLRKNYYLEKAFYFSEKNKGAVLQETIADSEAKSFSGIPDSLLKKEMNLKNAIATIEQKLALGPNESEEKTYRSTLFNLNYTYEQLIKQLETYYPEYYNLKFNNKTISIKEVQEALTKTEAVLSYFISDEKNRLVIFYISKSDFIVTNKPLPENLQKKINAFRNTIKLNTHNQYLKIANELYQLLIPSVINHKIEKLVIIPDGKLGSIPFEAFLYKKETMPEFTNLSYLLNKYDISYDYSCLLFYNTKSKITPITNKGILLCAPVNFDPTTELNSLPGSAEEVNKIEKLFQNKQIPSLSLMYKKAEEHVIKSNTLLSYSYLHFATHGIVNEEKPELSQLYLSKSTNTIDDGNLYAGEIYNLQINADLVVLSACETGLGKIKKGEGLIGLSRALLYAGANNLIVSLWTVSDASTSELMVNFYSTLLNDSLNNYSYSLRESKLKLIQQGKFSEPYYWAPFIFIGK